MKNVHSFLDSPRTLKPNASSLRLIISLVPYPSVTLPVLISTPFIRVITQRFAPVKQLRNENSCEQQKTSIIGMNLHVPTNL